MSAAMHKVSTIAVWLAPVVWLMMGGGACAVAQSDAFAGYTRHIWQASDGLPEQTVQAFAQTRDGYLWIGTSGGLVRFDGVHFTVFDRQNTPALHENSIFCLMVSRDGALWIGTEGGGLARYAQGRVPLVDHARGSEQRLCAHAGRGRQRQHLGRNG